MRGFPVTIVYGMADDDSHAEVVDRLRDLARKNENFRFRRHSNTHAKILIWDACSIKTSFNWLSFNPKLTDVYRQEDGTYRLDRTLTDRMYDRQIAEADANSTDALICEPIGTRVVGRVRRIDAAGAAWIALPSGFEGRVKAGDLPASSASTPGIRKGDSLEVTIAKFWITDKGRSRVDLRL